MLQQTGNDSGVQKRLVVVAGIDEDIGGAAAGLHVQQLAAQHILPHLHGAQRWGAAVQVIPDDAAGQAKVAGIQQGVAILIHIAGIGVDVDAEIAAGQALPQLRLEGMDALKNEDGVFIVLHGAGEGGALAGGKIEDGEFGVALPHQGIDAGAEAFQIQALDGFKILGAVLPQGHHIPVTVKIIQRDTHRPPSQGGKIGDEKIGGGGFAGGGGAAHTLSPLLIRML